MNPTARILELSYAHKLSHIGSNLDTYWVLGVVFQNMDRNDVVVLSCGHAGLAFYVALEKFFGADAGELLNRLGHQPKVSLKDKIYCTTGSLGQGITVAVGYALAGKNVHCIISDGECAEGSVWEALLFADRLPNFHVHVVLNGFSALAEVDTEKLAQRLRAIFPRINLYQPSRVNWPPFLHGLDAHYHVMAEEEYASTLPGYEKETGSL